MKEKTLLDYYSFYIFFDRIFTTKVKEYIVPALPTPTPLRENKKKGICFSILGNERTGICIGVCSKENKPENKSGYMNFKEIRPKRYQELIIKEDFLEEFKDKYKDINTSFLLINNQQGGMNVWFKIGGIELMQLIYYIFYKVENGLL